MSPCEDLGRARGLWSPWPYQNIFYIQIKISYINILQYKNMFQDESNDLEL